MSRRIEGVLFWLCLLAAPVALVAFGWTLQTAHSAPHGPIAFSLLIVAALWLKWAERRARTL